MYPSKWLLISCFLVYVSLYVISFFSARLISSNGINPTDSSVAPMWNLHYIKKGGGNIVGADCIRFYNQTYAVSVWENSNDVILHSRKNTSYIEWSFQHVGNVKSPEDGLLHDVDGDENVDIVIASEEQGLLVLWGPLFKEKTTIPNSRGTKWMQISFHKQNKIFIAGGKNKNAQLVSFRMKSNLEWEWNVLCDAIDWTMSIFTDFDMNNDGLDDIVVSDRSTMFWLESPSWNRYHIANTTEYIESHNFLDIYDLNDDGVLDILSSTRYGGLCWWFGPFTKTSVNAQQKDPRPNCIDGPYSDARGKDVTVGRITGNTSRIEIGYSSRNIGATNNSGVWWTIFGVWEWYRISGSEGTKFDHIIWMDMNNDDKLDLVTCEEENNLGVIWYQNPF